MDVEEAIRTRRTHKAYGPEPVDSQTLDELLELACWAPNHNLTNPWRFRVLGPDSLIELKNAAGREQASKLDRAPTLVLSSAVLTGDQAQDREDMASAACATYIVLLGAHARGLASYWRTPEVLMLPEARAVLELAPGEEVLGLIHLGRPRQEKAPPERAPLTDYVTYLP